MNTSTTTSTIVEGDVNPTAEEVVQEVEGLFSSASNEEEIDSLPSPSVLAENLGGEGVAFVDNSGSTGFTRDLNGSVIECMEKFIRELAPRRTALWNSTCNQLQPTSEIRWVACGGTSPSCIYGQFDQLASWSSFTFLTDGQVDASEISRLGNQAHLTSHLPTILGIATTSGNVPITSCNVSVLFSHFTAARTAVLVVITTELAGLGAVRVIKSKGEWEDSFGSLPETTPTAMLHDFPIVRVETLKALRARVHSAQPRNTVLLSGNTPQARWLHLDRLLALEDAMPLYGQVTEAEMEDIVRTFHSQGRLNEFRKWLADRSSELAARVQRSVENATSTSDCLGDAPSVAVIMSRLRNTRNAAEREALKAQLFSQVAIEKEKQASAAESAKDEVKSVRRLVDAGLRAACALDKAGMGADVLGRLSNRAMRAKKADRSQLRAMADLRSAGAPEAECNVMLDSGPAAILLKRVSPELAEENTGDFALDFPLVVGCWPRNDIFCPDVVGLANGTADNIEASQASVLGREDTVVAVPIIPLDTHENRNEVFLRLCLGFNDGLQMANVWQVALSSILRALEIKPWAAAGTPVGQLLHYLGAQIFAYIELQKGTRLALEETRLMNVAFAQCIGTEDFTQHYPIEGTVTAAAALIRWGAPTAAPTSAYTNSVIARAHRLVPQQYRNWMQSGNANSLPSSTTSLWESIFDLRHGENNFAPIAGTHHLPLSWGGLVDDHTRCILDRFATILALENQNSTTGTGCMSCADLLVRPGLALVVRGALAQITNPHISSAEAVQRTQRFHRAVAAEMDPRTVGSTTEDEAHAILAEWLLWARCPMRPLAPFATPYGASCLFFYHGRTRGGSVTNMTTGFQWNIDSAGEQESNQDRMARLAEHVRKVRGELLQQEYGFNKDGSFNKHTTSLPIHRCMSDEWGENGTDDPSHGSFISAVIERLISHKTGNLHMEALEHDIAMLCPSLLRAGRPTESGGYHAMRPLAAKIQLELAGRTVAELREEDAPPAIWVPREDPEIQERLREAQKATNARIAAIKEAILARKTTSESVKEAPKKQWTQEALARSITKILRHTADSQGLAVRPDAYVLVEKLLALDQFKGVTVEEVLIATVESDQKKRHQITEEDGVLMIRAVQGHSLAAVKPEALLELIQDAAEVPICIHGTYEKAFEAIMKSQLDRMSRNEIQMAVGLPDDPEVTSGVRSSVEVLIYIDVARAMEQGIRFFRSPNNVICSPGPIPTTCFAHVARRSDGMSLLPSAFDQANQTIIASPCEGNGEEPSILADLPTAVPVASQPSEKKDDKNDGQDTGTSGYKGSP